MLEPPDCDMVTPQDSPVTPQVCNTVTPEEQLCYQSSWTTCTAETLIQKLYLVKWETDCSISLCNAHVITCMVKRSDISWLSIWEFKAKWRQVKRPSPGIKLRTPDLCSYCSATELYDNRTTQSSICTAQVGLKCLSCTPGCHSICAIENSGENTCWNARLMLE